MQYAGALALDLGSTQSRASGCIDTLAAMHGRQKYPFAILVKHPKGRDDVPATVLSARNQMIFLERRCLDTLDLARRAVIDRSAQ